MFTGLVDAMGTVRRARARQGSLELEIEAGDIAKGLRRGDSVAINGVCLTATQVGRKRFRVQAMEETLAVSTTGSLRPGAVVNLEPAARLGDRIGGHLVQGHVDGVARALRVEELEGSRSVWFACSDELLRYFAPKGSVAVDGVSLTLVEVGRASFQVSLIPHTLEVTSLSRLAVGDHVNVEVDLIAKYVYRAIERVR